MTGTQKIVFKQALDRLKGIKEKHKIVSGRCLLPDHKEYEDWATKSDEVSSDLDFCVEMMQMIFNEMQNKQP